jgi:hypothetical protein
LLTFSIPNPFGTTLSKIMLRVHDKAQPQQSSTAENWLVRPAKNTDSADGTGPASYAGMHKIADSRCESIKITNF